MSDTVHKIEMGAGIEMGARFVARHSLVASYLLPSRPMI
jgi:hypothetical protein